MCSRQIYPGRFETEFVLGDARPHDWSNYVATFSAVTCSRGKMSVIKPSYLTSATSTECTELHLPSFSVCVLYIWDICSSILVSER